MFYVQVINTHAINYHKFIWKKQLCFLWEVRIYIVKLTYLLKRGKFKHVVGTEMAVQFSSLHQTHGGLITAILWKVELRLFEMKRLYKWEYWIQGWCVLMWHWWTVFFRFRESFPEVFNITAENYDVNLTSMLKNTMCSATFYQCSH